MLDYFNPVELSPDTQSLLQSKLYQHALHKQIVSHTRQHKPVLKTGYDIALIGVTESRNALNPHVDKGANAIREYLYKLMSPSSRLSIIDLGDLKTGNKISDTYAGLRDVLLACEENSVIPVVIGGSFDLMYALYLAKESLNIPFSMALADAKLHLNDEPDEPTDSLITKIILNNSHFLFNCSYIGYQNYFVSEKNHELLDQLAFDAYRLGSIRNDMKEAEPIIREADVVGISMRAIRFSDAPGQIEPLPNGFFGHEACQLAYYAGMSDKNTAIGLFDLVPSMDPSGVSSHLAAQIIWHYMQGIANRKKDYPAAPIESFTKYIVDIPSLQQMLIFYKSRKSGRWWIEINAVESDVPNIVACSEKDYAQACNQEIPERWWRYQQKLS